MRLMRVFAAVFVVSVALVGTTAIASPRPSTLVLRLADLPAGFTVQRTHAHASPADAARGGGTTLVQLRRWGFLRSYLVQFASGQAQMLSGPVTVVSAAALFRTAAGARAAKAADGGLGVDRLRVTAALGAEAWGYTYLEQQGDVSSRVYAVSWRRGAVQAYLALNGVAGVVTPQQLFTLATKQDRYLTRAG